MLRGKIKRKTDYMMASKEFKKFEELVQKIDSHNRLIRTWQVEGGVSAQVTALEVEQANGQRQKMIVRQHGEIDLTHNPQIAADEFKLLQILQSHGLVTPKPYYLDQSREIFSTPYIVIEYVEGKTEFAPSSIIDLTFQLATHLARIHTIDCAQLDISFLPQQENIYTEKLKARPTKVDISLDEGDIRDTLETVWPLRQQNASVLLHGDFWPGNILWRDGQIVAVIDWEDAKSGDPLADLANSRLEILWAFGVDAMDSFTHHYKLINAIDFTNLPCWDLCAALRPASKISEWAADDGAEKSMRAGHKLFITQAFEKLAAQ